MMINMSEKAINNIAMIGAGNVSFHLTKAFFKAGKNIVQIFGRNTDNGNSLAESVSAEFITDLSNLTIDADLYIVSVPDNVLIEVLDKINIPNKLIVHTSGTSEIEILKNTSGNYGVFYPLQTFTKTKNVDFKNIPVCIEANNKTNLYLLSILAKSISDDVKEITSEQRIILHVAAVFACNFSNYLYTIADEILEEHNLSFDLIKPLIQETAEKIQTHKPSYAQTGPAKREDYQTIETHLKALSKFPEFKDIYEILSKKIINHKKKK